MTHLHKTSGLYFECGELMDFPVKDARKTYDMTVITLWGCTDGDPDSPIIIGFYFGEYDAATTDYYIDQWLATQGQKEEFATVIRCCMEIVEAYDITNEGYLDAYYKNKVLTARRGLNKMLEVYNNEK